MITRMLSVNLWAMLLISCLIRIRARNKWICTCLVKTVRIYGNEAVTIYIYHPTLCRDYKIETVKSFHAFVYPLRHSFRSGASRDGIF